MNFRLRRDEYEYRKLGDKHSDDSGDEVELYPKKLYQEPPTVEKIVEEGDTLQSLAIRYGCSVSCNLHMHLRNIHQQGILLQYL